MELGAAVLVVGDAVVVGATVVGVVVDVVGDMVVGAPLVVLVSVGV